MSSPLPAHSPLGASGTHRWMECPGSVMLGQGHSDEESDHASLGTAAHDLGQYALTHRVEPWKMIGKVTPKGLPVDKEMADAIQVYVDAVEKAHPDRNQGNSWVERRFHCPTIHPLFYGTSDFVYYDAPAESVLHVWDYKHGAGIVVEVEQNPQLMYYACGALEALDLWGHVTQVVLHVVQPRAWHPAGPVRSWQIDPLELGDWLEDELIPAMERAATSTDLASGEHCRFCPVRFAKCPQLWADMEELEELMAKMDSEGAANMTTDELARVLALGETFKIMGKAARETAFARAQKGDEIPGWKLVAARADRIWKEDAEANARKKFKARDIMTEPKLISPAQFEKLPGGKAFVTENAFKPDKGLSLVPATDNRQERGPNKQGLFKPVKKTAGRRKSAT